MTKLKWHQIKEELVRKASAPTPPPADQFWAEFRLRASREGRTETVPTLWLWFVPSHAWAAAAAVAVLVGALWVTGVGKSGLPAVTPGSKLLVSAVEEINVFVPYSSMVILQDETRGATLVWLGNLGENKNGDG